MCEAVNGELLTVASSGLIIVVMGKLVGGGIETGLDVCDCGKIPENAFGCVSG